jgi:small GTP-binding protein
MMEMQQSANSEVVDALREQTVHLITDIATALSGTESEDRQRLLDVAQDLREAFFLVAIIGEFNAGKSTFVNALLGEALLPMGITPTTDAIELVRYSPTPVRVPTLREGSSVRVWGHPNTGAVGVALVDTPGSGSVFQRHETTAKGFLHRSDLVIFVLSAKRALAEADRLYLDLAKQYGKKIILVVNQIDLIDPNEREQVKRFVEQQVRQHLDFAPLVFMVSAKQALAGEDGGLGAVKAHLRGVFAQMSPARQKLLAQLETAARLTAKVRERLQDKYDTVAADVTRVRTIRSEMEKQSVEMDDPLTAARAEVDAVFEGLRQRGVTFIDANMNIRLLSRNPNKEQMQQMFTETVIGRAPRDLTEASTGYINAVVDHSRNYWRGVIDRLNKLKDVLEGEVTSLDASAYAQQREGLDEAIRIAESELRSYSSGQVMGELHTLFEHNMSGLRSGLTMTVGGLLAVILAIAPAGPVIGVGAAPLALPALVLGAPLLLYGGFRLQRSFQKLTRQVKTDYLAKVTKLQKTYHEAMDSVTRKEQNRLSQYGMQVMAPIFSHLEAIAQTSKQQLDQFNGYTERIESLNKTLNEVK